jgi:large subunit ribosomal protein L24
MHIKKGDHIVVLSGSEKGKKGKVAKAMPKLGLVVVEGINMKKKHQRSRREGKPGQIIEIALPLRASKVGLASN